MVARARTRFRYQVQGTDMTLAEGLAEYYDGHPEVTRPSDLAPESADLFRHHDVCHVIFGLDTTLPDEGMADVRTMLGTDVGLRRYMRYLRTNAQAQAIFAEIGWGKALLSLVPQVPRMVWACFLALRQKRLSWETPEFYFQMPLCDIRTRHRIRVF